MRITGQIIGLGLLNGSRGLALTALLSRRLAQTDIALSGPSRLLSRTGVSRMLQVLALLELVGDKMPDIPARTEPPGVISRAIGGAVIGATLGEAWGRPRLRSAAIGALASVVGTFIGYYARRELTSDYGGALPDPLVALVEDAIVLVGGSALLHLPPEVTAL